MSPNRHVPMRTCVVCGAKSAKGDLMRIVATSRGAVMVDSTGKMDGRGAYVCRGGTCLNGSLKRNRLSYVLRSPIADDAWREIERSVESVATQA